MKLLNIAFMKKKKLMKRAKNVNIRGDFMIFGQKEAYLKKKVLVFQII